MNTSLLVADENEERRSEVCRFFSRRGFRAFSAANPAECLSRVVALNPHILIISCDILWTQRDGVVARFIESLRLERNPLVLVIGDQPAERLSERAGMPVESCFSEPIRNESLLDWISLSQRMLASEPLIRASPIDCRIK